LKVTLSSNAAPLGNRTPALSGGGATPRHRPPAAARPGRRSSGPPGRPAAPSGRRAGRRQPGRHDRRRPHRRRCRPAGLASQVPFTHPPTASMDCPAERRAPGPPCQRAFAVPSSTALVDRTSQVVAASSASVVDAPSNASASKSCTGPLRSSRRLSRIWSARAGSTPLRLRVVEGLGQREGAVDPRHRQNTAGEGACRKRPGRGDHDRSPSPKRAGTHEGNP